MQLDWLLAGQIFSVLQYLQHHWAWLSSPRQPVISIIFSEKNMNCFACERIKQIKAGQNPYFLAEMHESYAVLADDQRYEGYCILLLKTHEEHLAQLSAQRQLELFEDVVQIAEAITRSFHPLRLNYECLGNTLAHVHWHVIPRYEWDPEPNSPVHVRPKEERKIGVEPGRLTELVTTLKSHLNEKITGG